MSLLVIAFVCGAVGGLGALALGWGWWALAAYLVGGWIGLGLAVAVRWAGATAADTPPAKRHVGSPSTPPPPQG